MTEVIFGKRKFVFLLSIMFVFLLAACSNYNMGRVVDENGEGLEDVRVKVNGQQVETTSEGYFAVKRIADEGATFVFAKEGFNTKKLEVISGERQEIGEFVLKRKSN